MLTELRMLFSRAAASLGGWERGRDEEIRLHMEMLVNRYVAQGMTEEEAGWAAQRQFGRESALREELREKRSFPQIDTLWRETILAFRQLRRKPSFTISIVLTLAIGIGASAAIFGITYAVLLHALPYADPDRLVSFQSARSNRDHAAGVPGPDSLSYPDFFDFRKQNKVFSQLVSYRDSQFTLTTKVPAVQLQGEIVSWDLFPMLGVKLLQGGGFHAEDEAPGMHVAVLSYRLWKEQFGGEPDVAGRTMSINGRGYTVAGVAPAGFQFPPQNPGVELWVTLAEDSVGTEANPLSVQRGARTLDAMGRLAPGVTRERAKSEMDAIAEGLARQYPDNDGNYRATWVHPALDAIIGDTKIPLLILCGAVGLLLLVACANVANLLLVRGSERRQEFAMRAALGASQSAILRQWLWETLALGSIGCGTGLVAATLLLRIASTMGGAIPRLTEAKLSWPVVAFAVGLMLLTSVAFSILPAFQSFRLNLERVLRDGSRSNTGRGMRVRSTLVISQITLSLTLLTGAEVLMASFIHLAHRDPGFEPDHVLTFSVGLSDSAYPKREQQLAFWNRMLTSLRALPGVKQAATGAVLPLSGDQMSVSFDIEERRQPPNSRPHSAMSIVSPDYFSSLGIRLLKGRSFSEHDNANGTPVLVVNQAFADRFFPGEEVLGKRIEPGATNGKEGTRLREIVGVVGNARQNPLAPSFEPIYYFPYQQLTWFFGSVILKTSGPPRALENSVRVLLAGLDKEAPIYDVRTMDELASAGLGSVRFPSVLLSSFAGITLLLTAIGLYGALAYSVEMRRREFGIRIALGAAPGQVLSIVIRKAVLLIVIGLVAGVVLSLGAQRVVGGIAFVVSQGAAGLLLSGCLILIVTGLLAASLPAFRAATIDPIETLRQE